MYFRDISEEVVKAVKDNKEKVKREKEKREKEEEKIEKKKADDEEWF